MSTSTTSSEPEKIINDCTEDAEGNHHPLDNIIEAKELANQFTNQI